MAPKTKSTGRGPQRHTPEKQEFTNSGSKVSARGPGKGVTSVSKAKVHTGRHPSGR